MRINIKTLRVFSNYFLLRYNRCKTPLVDNARDDSCFGVNCPKLNSGIPLALFNISAIFYFVARWSSLSLQAISLRVARKDYATATVVVYRL